ncbi:hypothetical protein JW949_04585 [Candidatus Woesearchaeota archaeon]|nr:hypothetical protein [Candidatus Woesearchaeota archaeon]
MAFLGFFKKNNKKEDKITNKSSESFNIRNLDETSKSKTIDKFPLDIPEPPVPSSKDIKKPSLNIDLPEPGKIPEKTEPAGSLKKSLMEEVPEKEFSFKGPYESAFEDEDMEKPKAEDFPLPELGKEKIMEKEHEPDESYDQFKPEGYEEPETVKENEPEIQRKEETQAEKPVSSLKKKDALEIYFRKRDSFEDKLDLFVDINNYNNVLDNLDEIAGLFRKEAGPSNKLRKIEKKQVSLINEFIDVTEDVQSQLMLIDKKIFEK